jgi:hypothetical protein
MRKTRSWVLRSRQAFPGSWHDGFASSAGSPRAGPGAPSLCACPLRAVRDPQCAAFAARGICVHRRSADRRSQGVDTRSPPTSDVPLRRVTRADATGWDLARKATARSSCGRRSLEWASPGIIPLLGDLRRASTDRRPARSNPPGTATPLLQRAPSNICVAQSRLLLARTRQKKTRSTQPRFGSLAPQRKRLLSAPIPQRALG